MHSNRAVPGVFAGLKSMRLTKFSHRSALSLLAIFLAAGSARAGIVTQYSFENNLSDSASSGANTDTLTYVQGSSSSVAAQFTAGVVGRAGVFDGNYFSALDSADLSLIGNTWAIELFVKVSSHNAAYLGNQWDRLVTKWGASYDYTLHFKNKNLDFYDSAIGNVIPEKNTVPATDFTVGWHHVAVTSSGTGSRAWIDGVSVFTGNAITLVDGTDLFALGDLAGSGAHASLRFKGWMDEVRIHDSAVDQTYINSRVAIVAVPEPSTAVLAGLGLAGIAACGVRRLRRS